MGNLMGLLGIVALLAVAVLLSSNRRWIRLRVVGPAFLLQAGFAFLVLGTPWGRAVIQTMSDGVTALLSYAAAGTEFVFGPIAGPAIGGNSFAIAALPVIIFFASLISVLYYLGIMQFIIKWVGGAIQKVTGITKIESLGAAANIFVGQSESPLVIRPYLAGLTPSQLFTVMTVGMAGVAGTILGAYAGMIGEQLLPYLLAASFMSAPGGILMAKIMMPDDPASIGVEPVVLAEASHDEERPANLIMAAAQGAQTGVKLAVAVGAMVLAFVALVALANGLLASVGQLFGQTGWSFQAAVGAVFRPIMWLMGVPWDESAAVGGLFGTKVVLNEFVAFIDLGKIRDTLSPAGVAIGTFALCGFANFSSIAIQMAVTGGLAPNQRPMIAKLGLKALLAGSLANLMSAALAGLMLTLAPPPAAPTAAPTAPAASQPAPAPAASQPVPEKTAAVTRFSPNYVELAARDVAASRGFYTAAFDMAFTDYGPDYAAAEGGAVQLGLMAEAEAAPARLVIETDDLAAAEARVRAAGGTITKPSYAYPGGERFEATDPAGNPLAVYRPAPPSA